MNTLLFCHRKHGAALTPAFHLKDSRALAGGKLKKHKRLKIMSHYQKAGIGIFFFCSFKWFVDQGIDQFPIDLNETYYLSLESFLLFNLTGLSGVKWDYLLVRLV